MSILGVPSNHYISWGKRKSTFFHKDFTPKLKANSKNRIKLPNETSLKEILGSCDPNFIDFLEHCLEWEPENRFTP